MISLASTPAGWGTTASMIVRHGLEEGVVRLYHLLLALQEGNADDTRQCIPGAAPTAEPD